MQEEIFADAIGEIQVTNNVVRIDFVSLSPTERDTKNNPKAVFRQRVVMPIDAFGNAAELIRRAMEGLLKSGAMWHAEKPATRVASAGTWDRQSLLGSETPVPSPNETTNGASPSSPNFAPA